MLDCPQQQRSWPHLPAELRLAEQAALREPLVQVSAPARLEHQAQVGGVIKRATQLHHAWHPAGVLHNVGKAGAAAAHNSGK